MGSCNDQLWSHGNDWRWRVLDNYVIMPITIAGSGTITGLSAGGLPAGSVTAATLASGAGGITEADQWRLTGNVQGDVDPVTGTWERNDTSGFNKLGTGLTQSSGVFSFPSTGIWQITATAKSHHSATNKWAEFMIYTTIDNGTWVKQTEPGGASYTPGGNSYANSTFTFIFDVTSTTNCKARFAINQEDGDAYLTGNSDYNTTHVTFIRLGDT